MQNTNSTENEENKHHSQAYDDELLTVQEAARYLKLTPSTVRALARSGKIRGVKVGRVWRFERKGLVVVKELL